MAQCPRCFGRGLTLENRVNLTMLERFGWCSFMGETCVFVGGERQNHPRAEIVVEGFQNLFQSREDTSRSKLPGRECKTMCCWHGQQCTVPTALVNRLRCNSQQFCSFCSTESACFLQKLMHCLDSSQPCRLKRILFITHPTPLAKGTHRTHSGRCMLTELRSSTLCSRVAHPYTSHNLL